LHNDFALSCFVFSECENKIYEVNPSVFVSSVSVTRLASPHWSRLTGADETTDLYTHLSISTLPLSTHRSLSAIPVGMSDITGYP